MYQLIVWLKGRESPCGLLEERTRSFAFVGGIVQKDDKNEDV